MCTARQGLRGAHLPDKEVVLRRGDRATAQTLVRLRGCTDMGMNMNTNGRDQYRQSFDLTDAVPGYEDKHPLKADYNIGRLAGSTSLTWHLLRTWRPRGEKWDQ